MGVGEGREDVAIIPDMEADGLPFEPRTRQIVGLSCVPSLEPVLHVAFCARPPGIDEVDELGSGHSKKIGREVTTVNTDLSPDATFGQMLEVAPSARATHALPNDVTEASDY